MDTFDYKFICTSSKALRYKKIYDSLIAKAVSRDHEKGVHEIHHIVPISLSGSNNKSNLVSLTYREHFLAHWLLTKFTTGAARFKMLQALTMMSGGNCRTISSWQYVVSKKAAYESWSPERREERRSAQKGDKNIMNIPEVKQRHKENVPRGEKHPCFGLCGDKNVMRRPEVKEAHKKSVPRGDDHMWTGLCGDKNVMSKSEIKKRQKENVPRGENHYAKNYTGDKNIMHSPEVKLSHLKAMEKFKGKGNVVHRPDVKEKMKFTNKTFKTRHLRTKSSATITEDTARKIYEAEGTISQIAKRFQVSYNTVYPIKKKLSWTILRDR